jgi:uncharacterized membrane protein
LPSKLKNAQAIIFCSVLSISIFAFVLIEEPIMAAFGAIVEIIINIYYYFEKYWKNKIDKRKDNAHPLRRNWIKVFMAFLFPVFIYILSHFYAIL